MLRLPATFLFLVFVFSSCTNWFYYPSKDRFSAPGQFGLIHENVSFQSSDGTELFAWFLPAKGEAFATVLFLHGNAENISTHINSVLWMPERGLNVFLLDYRGYGASSGTPTVDGVHRDVEAAISHLVLEKKSYGKPLVLFGQSLGGAMAIYAAANSPHRDALNALIVDSAFSSYRRIVRDKLASSWLSWPFQYPLSWLVVESYSPERYVAQLDKLPVLFIHGGNDQIVLPYHTDVLFEKALQPKLLLKVPNKGHIAVLQERRFQDEFVNFLREALSSSDA